MTVKQPKWTGFEPEDESVGRRRSRALVCCDAFVSAVNRPIWGLPPGGQPPLGYC
jgi:hypothetical protein